MSHSPDCPSCWAENPPGFAFCGYCGASLAPPVVTEERKVVTMLFCDLVGYTAHTEAADHELIDSLLQRYNALAKKLVRAHGGVVEKFIGDAVLAVFGFPKAHDDDAERAVRCGLRLAEAAGELSWPDGDPLQVRVGVNTGETYLHTDVDPASGETFLTGDAVNTAARLETAAPPGSVVVGEVTHRLTSQTIVYQKLAALVVKGKKQPVAAWLAREPQVPAGLRTSGATSTPFLGRTAELAALQDAFEAAATSKKTQFVLVSGEPGIGKSRLVLEFARACEAKRTSVTWRQGRCLPCGEGVTFRALSDILEVHAGVLDSDDAAIVEAKLEAVLPEGEDGAWLRRRLRPLLGLEASKASREENFAAWTRMMEIVAAARPAVIVIEDLHWAGEAMLAFIEHLLSADLDVPLLVVATTRPELLQQHVGLFTTTDEAGGPRHLTLPTLSHVDVGVLVAELLGAELAAAEGTRIVERVGGNPLYAEQYVRLLLDRGLIVGTAGGVRLEADEGLPVPDSVQAVLAARLDTLPSAQKQLLCNAAVIGESFWRGTVAALSGCEASSVDGAMSALAERDFVRPVVAPSLEGEVEYLFWHALVRDVAYGQLPRKVRARKHQAAALWIERRAGTTRDEFTDVVAHHYVAAHDLACASRDKVLAAALVEPTVGSLARAGHRALCLDVAAAERHFTRGLELAGQDEDLRLSLLPGWAEALLLRGHFRESAAACREAIASHESHGDRRGAAVGMCRLAIALSSLGESVGDVTQSAVELLATDDPSPEQAEVLGHYALSLLLLNDDPSSVLEAAARAIEVCSRLGLPEPAVARNCHGLARLSLGDIRGTDDIERALVAAREQGLGIERSTIVFNSVSPALVTRGALAAYEVTRDGLDFTLRHGLEAYALSFRVGLVESLEQMGDWDRALAEAAELVSVLEESEDAWDLVSLRSLQTLMLSWRGQSAEAAPLVDALETAGAWSEVGWTAACALLAASVARLALGETREALRLLTQCLAVPRAVASLGDNVPEAVRAALAAGDDGLAAWVMRELESSPEAQKLPLQQLVATTVAALVKEGRGEHEASCAGFADAARRWHEFGMPYEEGQALLGQGRCLVAVGRAPEAAPALAAAREIFARLGALPALEETDAALAAAGL